MTQPQDVALPTAFDQLLASHGLPILADFWADWCEPCKIRAPVLADLAKQWKGRITVIKVDTEKKPELAGRYRISGIPTLILFKQGREEHRFSGAIPLSRLKQEFEPFL